MKYLFDVKTNEEYGMKGLQLRSLEGAEPMGAMTCTHDIFEHLNGFLDSDQEAMALGAMLYVRGEGGYFDGGYHSIGSNLSSDLTRLITDSDTWGEITYPGETRPLDEHVEEWISVALSLAMKELLEEEHDFTFDQLDHIRSWFRKGYREAKKTYKAEPWDLSQAFRAMTADLEEALNLTEEDMCTVVSVDFDRKTLEFKVCTLEIYDEDHPEYEEPYFDDDEEE